MITQFICDSCYEQIEGEPWGYAEEGDRCLDCYKRDEISYIDNKLHDVDQELSQLIDKKRYLESQRTHYEALEDNEDSALFQ